MRGIGAKKLGMARKNTVVPGRKGKVNMKNRGRSMAVAEESDEMKETSSSISAGGS